MFVSLGCAFTPKVLFFFFFYEHFNEGLNIR